MKVTFTHQRVITVLAYITLFLILLSTIGQVLLYLTHTGTLRAFTHLFFVGAENNLPTAFSSMLMLTISVLCLLFWREAAGRHDTAVQWLLLAILFCYMSADEMLVWHEKFLDPARYYLRPFATGLLYYTWVVPGLAVVVVLALYFLRFALRLPSYLRNALIGGFILFFSGALVMEAVAGKHAELFGTKNLTYSMYTTVEESLEFAGLLLVIYGLLRYATELGVKLAISFSAEE